MMQFLRVFLAIMFFMPYLKGYAALPPSFQGTKVTPKGQTEASSKDDTSQSLDKCCYRNENIVPFSDLSEQESQAKVNFVLSQRSEGETTTPPSDSSGNR